MNASSKFAAQQSNEMLGLHSALVVNVAEAMRYAKVGRTKLYELIAAGKLDARKAGSRTLIMADSLRAYIENLPPADIRTGQRDIAA